MSGSANRVPEADDSELLIQSRQSSAAPVSSLLYRSRARRPFDGTTLAKLLHAARLRNRSEAVTGLLLYDEGLFLQWLEGPPDGLDRVVSSIRRDARHGEIEILTQADNVQRTFGSSDMRLAASASSLSPLPPDSSVLPRRLLDAVEARPGLCGRLLPFFLDDDPVEPACPIGPLCGTVAPIERKDLLREAIDLVVRARLEGDFPGLARVLERERTTRVANDLARLVVRGHDDEAHDLLVSQCESGDPFASCAGLIEPTAEALGDLWSHDECSDTDLTVSLCQLQTEFRRMCSGWPIDWARKGDGRTILVASVPGEYDSLGPALASEALWRAGFRVELAFPETEDALLEAAKAASYDAVHLSLSPVFAHGERLGRLAAMLWHLRQASPNKDIRVLVSGRAFREDPAAALRVGADAATPTVVRIERALGARARHLAA
jgi:methanogenic corrinoid protein MtbC1